MPRRIVLDLSRLLSRAGFGAPTGIDRVELAYAEHLIAAMPERLGFAGLNQLGRIVAIAPTAGRALVALSATSWRQPGSDDAALRRLARRLRLAMLAGDQRDIGGIYLLISHHHLDRPQAIEAWLRRTRSRLACMVHDLIPIEFPEYARPGQDQTHRRRMETVARLADAVIANSAATARSLSAVFDRVGRAPPVRVAPLGIDLVPAADAASGQHFVCIGTIEPRKNHLLLLNIWRRLAQAGQTGPTAPPPLILIGRRGWENENAVDMIERCAALRGLVEERAGLSDAEMSDLLRTARALLLPSFAEGYGLPLAEALALGTPALCSDLPALREVGADVPDYLDPLDGPAWIRAIHDYAAPDSPRRAAQLARLAHWRAPSWQAHMATALDLLDGIAVSEGMHG